MRFGFDGGVRMAAQRVGRETRGPKDAKRNCVPYSACSSVLLPRPENLIKPSMFQLGMVLQMERAILIRALLNRERQRLTRKVNDPSGTLSPSGGCCRYEGKRVYIALGNLDLPHHVCERSGVFLADHVLPLTAQTSPLGRERY